MRIQLKILSALAVMGSACVSMAPPKELTEAKRLYEKSRHEVAGQVNPAGLHEAANAINDAEAAYTKNPESVQTRDLSYVALRKVQLAEANADVSVALLKRHMLEKDRVARMEKELAASKAELALANQKLAEESNKTAMAPPAPPPRKQDRGEVMTISGSVLFASGQSDLLDSASTRLDQVAETLIKASPPGILITGYADSQGSAAFNKQLSRLRAESVRDYLVEHGVPNQNIRTEGKGESDPIADNSTSEGRAMNRRVEIVLLKAVSSM